MSNVEVIQKFIIDDISSCKDVDEIFRAIETHYGGFCSIILDKFGEDEFNKIIDEIIKKIKLTTKKIESLRDDKI